MKWLSTLEVKTTCHSLQPGYYIYLLFAHFSYYFPAIILLSSDITFPFLTINLAWKKNLDTFVTNFVGKTFLKWCYVKNLTVTSRDIHGKSATASSTVFEDDLSSFWVDFKLISFKVWCCVYNPDSPDTNITFLQLRRKDLI